MPFIYIVTGLILFFFIFNIFETYVLRLKVETAVVSAPIETMVAPVNGYITDVFVKTGELVKKGSPLLKIENIDIERDLLLARVQVEEAKLNVEYYKNLLINEHQRLEIYQSIGANRVNSAQYSVNSSKQDAITAEHNLDRLSVLHKKHYISEANWETELAKSVSAQEKLKNAKSQHALESQSLNAVEKGMYFTGNKLEGSERDLSAELTAAEKKAKLNSDKVKIYEKLNNKLTLLAPFDGKVTQILKSAGNTTDNIKPIIFIEQTTTNKNIIAYLTQDEILQIGPSRKVKIYLPSSSRTYNGKVIEINRTDGFVDAVKAQYRWRDFQIDRSAMVTIDIQESDKTDFDQHVFPGMPAIVYFSRKITFF